VFLFYWLIFAKFRPGKKIDLDLYKGIFHGEKKNKDPTNSPDFKGIFFSLFKSPDFYGKVPVGSQEYRWIFL